MRRQTARLRLLPQVPRDLPRRQLPVSALLQTSAVRLVPARRPRMPNVADMPANVLASLAVDQVVVVAAVDAADQIKDAVMLDPQQQHSALVLFDHAVLLSCHRA
ncbi:MAG: hypothetical protein NVS4B8_10110 [Herpetosiphon sp.]